MGARDCISAQRMIQRAAIYFPPIHYACKGLQGGESASVGEQEEEALVYFEGGRQLLQTGSLYGIGSRIGSVIIFTGTPIAPVLPLCFLL